MTGTLAGTKPDVDLTNGNFYSDRGAHEVYRWMRANEPVFRDSNGLAAAATYQAVIEAERDPETFSNTGGIRPDQPGMPYMIDMDDPAHLLRRKLVNAGFTRKRVMDKAPGIGTRMGTGPSSGPDMTTTAPARSPCQVALASDRDHVRVGTRESMTSLRPHSSSMPTTADRLCAGVKSSALAV